MARRGFCIMLLACAPVALAQTAPAQVDTDLSVTADLGLGAAGVVPLYLEVRVNGKPTNLVAEFALDAATGRMSAPASELDQLGLRAGRKSGAMVDLATIPGVQFAYDEPSQSIDIRAPLSALQTDVVSAVPEAEQLDPERSFGAVLNYALDGEYQAISGAGHLATTSASLDGWVFAPLGTLRTTGVIRDAQGTGSEALRLETTFQSSSPKRRVTFALGDVQTSSLAWSRSIRMGGVQLRRDFGLRSDLVTQQLLSFDGASAVPSTIDVFIDNNRTYTTGQEAGPFRLEDLPAASGPGEALIVVTDANGRRTTEAVSFYVSQKLLKKGLLDYSIEAGHAREAYGIASSDYGRDGLVSGSLRFGLTERITLEGNVQVKSDLQTLGLGLTTVPFNLAEVSLAAGASDYSGTRAAFAFGSVQTRVDKVSLSASVRWSQDGFADLAYATGVDYLGQDAISDTDSLLETPRLQTALNVSFPLDAASNLGLGYVSSQRSSSDDALVTASYGRDLPKLNGSLSLYGSHDLLSGETRASMGLSVTLGKRKSLRTTTSIDPDGGVLGGVYVSRAISDRHGDFGYAAELQRDSQGTIQFSGQGEYLGRFGKSTVNLRSGSGSQAVRVQLDGAIAMAGGAVAIGNRITDSFAIVDAGAAGIPVSVHNRSVTTTGASGKALVTGLASHRRNRVSVDVASLPQDVLLDATAMDVVPGIGSGVRVTLKGNGDTSAVVTLLDAAGVPLQPGAVAFANGGREEFFVGFGGETLIEDLGRTNRLTVRHDRGTCTAEFSFAPRPGPLQIIENVVCR